ncbi:hypothetical protein [uncultured Metabacillus sp.]|uniref:hypothetical protein n=1 Tax=uncultured Metabacillus sp. TaxID=2860135 RepID=UPI00263904FD|nr:hypothetical protein [uncultured Metabacillus sp.]
MMLVTSQAELTSTNDALQTLKKDFPTLFQKLMHVVNLTRALQFNYQYMGCLIMDEDAEHYTPSFVYGSVLRLYKKEVQKLRDDENFDRINKFLSHYKKIGYAKISLLILGHSPETLVGPSSIK